MATPRVTGDQYDALRWCYDMAAQDHRVPETRERLWLARQALRELIPNRDAPVMTEKITHVPDDRWGFVEHRPTGLGPMTTP